MKTFVIHAPSSKAQSEHKRSFDQTLKMQIGDGYAISRSEYGQITPGCRVIVLDNETRRRAEGTLVKLEPDGWTNSGMQRYDVYMRDVSEIRYEPVGIRLNHRGIAIM